MSAPPPQLSDAPPPYDAVVFDCDSTLSAIEGIEELARGESLGVHAAELRELTQRAMDGEIPLEAAYGRRLELVAPSLAELAHVAELYAEHALPHAHALCAALRALGKDVHIVSGGLLPAVRPFGAWLGIDAANVQAVDVAFDARGAYAGFDADSPLARAGGKVDVLSGLREPAGAQPRTLAFVGDGATDLEAAHLASRFIAFGGVERRERVFEAALVKTEAADLAALVPLLFSQSERATLSTARDHAALIEAARPFARDTTP